MELPNQPILLTTTASCYQELLLMLEQPGKLHFTVSGTLSRVYSAQLIDNETSQGSQSDINADANGKPNYTYTQEELDAVSTIISHLWRYYANSTHQDFEILRTLLTHMLTSGFYAKQDGALVCISSVREISKVYAGVTHISCKCDGYTVRDVGVSGQSKDFSLEKTWCYLEHIAPQVLDLLVPNFSTRLTAAVGLGLEKDVLYKYLLEPSSFGGDAGGALININL